MPGPYQLTLDSDSKGFDYPTGDPANPTAHLNPGETTPQMDACAFIDVVNAASAANPGKGGVRNIDMDAVREECGGGTSPAVTPSPAANATPLESDPASEGGDSAALQCAPDPPIAGTATEAPATTPETVVPTEEPTRPSLGEPQSSHDSDQPQRNATAGDPVDLFTGTFVIEEADLTIPNAVVPLAFTRVYRSGASYWGPFGWNWDHCFNAYLRELNSGDVAVWRNLSEQIFRNTGAQFEPPRGAFEVLDRLPGPATIFEVREAGGRIRHYERPAGWLDPERIPLLWIADRHGNRLRCTYGGEDKLTDVRDDDGRGFLFAYDACGLLVSVTDHTGRRFEYGHDEERMHLVRVKSPAVRDFPDGVRKEYEYEAAWAPPELRHNILRVSDGQGKVYLENSYEMDPAQFGYSRVKEQLFGGFLYQYRYTHLQWVPADALFVNVPALRVEMMTPEFGLETFTFNYRGDLLDRRFRLSRDGSFRVVVWQYEVDEQGNLAMSTRPDGSQEVYQFDFASPDPRMRGCLLQKELTAAAGFPSPSRIVWRGRYEPRYQLLTREENERGAVTEYRYDFDVNPGAPSNSGKLVELIQPQVTLPGAGIQQSRSRYEHNDRGQLTATVLPDGTRNEFEYGLGGPNQAAMTRSRFDVAGLNVERAVEYDGNGYVRAITDGNGHQIRRTVNALGLLETMELPSAGGQGVTDFYYDADGLLIAAERPAGRYADASFSGTRIRDEIERDVLGYPVSHRQAINTAAPRITRVCSDYRGRPSLTRYPDGSRLERKYDERGLLIREDLVGTDGKRIVRQTVHDRAGNVTRTSNSHGSITEYACDGFSRLHQVTLPNGTVIRRTWLNGDLLGTEETIGDDGTGVVRTLSLKRFEYDVKGRKIREVVRSFTDDMSVGVDLVTGFHYDVVDRVIEVVNARGGRSSRTFDRLGRLVEQIDPMGNVERWQYDGAGNVVATEAHHREPDTTISMVRREYEYDARNRRVRGFEADGAFQATDYDDRDLVQRITDQLGNETERIYDAFGNQLTERIDPGGLDIVRSWTYDTQSHLTAFRDPLGEVSSYHYDSLGRLQSTVYPNGLSIQRIYDDHDRVIQERKGSGATFDYTYDAASRVIRIENSAVPSSLLPVVTHELTYDGLDRLTSAVAGTLGVTRRYDSLSRIIEETGSSGTMSCSYDEPNGTLHRLWPDGRTEVQSYDLNGFLSRIEETAAGLLGGGLARVDYAPSGANYLGEVRFDALMSLKYRYDQRKRAVAMTGTSQHGTLASIRYAYSAANQRHLEALSGTAPSLSYFGFDRRKRLIEAARGLSFSFSVPSTQAEHDSVLTSAKAAASASPEKEAFAYDACDRRVTATDSGSPVRTYTYLPGHRIASNGLRAFQFNVDGVLEDDGRFRYEADARGRIRRIFEAGSKITDIEYDALGRPALIAEAGAPERTLTYFGNLVYEESEGGAPVRQFTRHPFSGAPVAVHVAGNTIYPLCDPRHNLCALVGPAGAVIEQYRYKTFGRPSVHDENGIERSNSAFGMAPIFGGQTFLFRCGKYLSQRRLMDPEEGLFLSPDPKEYVDSPSLYVYVSQNPADYTDMFGDSKSPQSIHADANASADEDDHRWYQNPYWSFLTHNGFTFATALFEEVPQHVYIFDRFLKPFSNLAVFGKSGVTRFFGSMGWSGLLKVEDMLRAPASRLPFLFKDLSMAPPWSRLPMSRINAVLAPLGLVSNAASLYDAVFHSTKTAPERIADGTFSSLGLFSSGVGTTSLLGWVLGPKGGMLMRGASFLQPAALVTGAGAGGYFIGQFIDEKLGWHEALAARANLNRDIYNDAGLNDTAAGFLGGVALLPVVSEIGQGAGWAAYQGYQGASYAVEEIGDAYGAATDYIGYELCVPFVSCD